MKWSWAKVKDILGVVAPYAVIFVVSFLPYYIFFASNGMTWGDDATWHMAELADLAYGFEHGFTGLSTAHNILGSSGYNIYGFYGPFPHYFVVVVYEIFKGMGASMAGCLKFSILLSVFLSGLFVYWLGLKVSGSRHIGLVVAVLYTFLPYKMYCVLYRGAYSEVFALGFIPMVFYAAYRMLHDEKFRVAPFVILTVSASCLVMSHPITALVTACAAVVYLLANAKSFPRLFRSWRNIVAFSCSIAFIVGLVSVYVFPVYENTSTGLYVISDDEVMWTSYNQLVWWSRYSNPCSGFLSFSWLVNYWENQNILVPADTSWGILFGVGLFVFEGILLIVIDPYFKTLKGQKYWRYAADMAILFVPAAIFQVRIEEWYSLLAFALLFLVVDFLRDKDFEGDVRPATPLSLLKTPDLYFLIAALIWLAILIYVPEAWKIVPTIFYKIQFMYRLWGLFGFLAVFLVIYLLKLAKGHEKALLGVGLTAGVLFLFCDGPLDKRIAHDYGDYSFLNDKTEADLHLMGKMGSQDEYMPRIFLSKENYSSQYSNSLYYTMKPYLVNRVPLPYGSDYLTPVYLEGSGTMTVTAVKTPEVSLEMDVTSDSALVQIPQFYYKGYQITLTDKATGASLKEEGQYVDGLVSFTASKGSYEVNVKWAGPTSYRLGKVFFYISAVGVTGLGVWGFWDRKRREKKEKAAAPAVAS